MELSKKIGLVLGPVAFLILNNLPFELVSEKGDPVISVAIWMLIWWITEAVSISVTALLPLLLLPILKILPIAEVGANYGSPIVFLFFGGFVMALALTGLVYWKHRENIRRLLQGQENRFGKRLR